MARNRCGLSVQPDERDRAFIARIGPTPVASLFCLAEPDAPEVARLRLFLIEPAWRGTGLADRMMAAFFAFARTQGYRRVRL